MPDLEQQNDVANHFVNDAPPTQIVLDKLSYSIKDKVILDNINAVFQPGKLTALVGPSGSGKTTLLSLIAGMQGASVGKSVSKTGNILFNGEEMTQDKIKKFVGFVFQDDVILETMTVTEAIDLSIKLRVNLDTKSGDILRKKMIDVTQLNKARNTTIGSPQRKGISGGERKRTAIAMEMVSNPSILLLDEPTSGLDTYTAFRIVALLKRLAHKYGRTVVATLHQPSSEIFHMIDNIYVLNDGRMVYGGERKQLVNYFSKRGYMFDEYSNPNDVLFMSILNKSEEDEFSQELAQEASSSGSNSNNGRAEDQQPEQQSSKVPVTLENLPSEYDNSEEYKKAFTDVSIVRGGVPKRTHRFRAKSLRTFILLMNLNVKTAYRNPLVIQTKLAQTIFLAGFLALAYIKTRDAPVPDIYQNIFVVIFFLIVNAFFASFQNTVPTFAAEKGSFSREVAQGYYNVGTYFFAKILIELPLTMFFPILSSSIVYWVVGLRSGFRHWLFFVFVLQAISLCGFSFGLFAACLFKDISVALALSILFLLPAMIFGGLFLNVSSVPSWLRWLQWVSPIRYGTSAVMENQFGGWTAPGAQDYYVSMDVNDGFPYGVNLVFLLGLFLLALIAAFFALVRVTLKAQGNAFLTTEKLRKAMRHKPSESQAVAARPAPVPPPPIEMSSPEAAGQNACTFQ